MSFESVYRSKQGAKEIEKIADFIGSLVIKNEYEARRGETTESLSLYYEYHGAYTRTDDFTDYDLSFRLDSIDLASEYIKNLKPNYIINVEILKTLAKSRVKVLQAQYKSGNQIYKDYLNALRYVRTKSYDEKNLYYRQFLGIPNSDDDIIYVINMDVGENGYTKVEDFSNPPNPDLVYFRKVGDDEFEVIGKLESWYEENPDGTQDLVSDSFYYINMTPIHLITKDAFPITYSYLILQQHITEIISAHPDLSYLRFIGKELTPYYLRNLANYSIISYNQGVLNSEELASFFKAYNKAKQQVILDYINGFDSKQPMYNLLMIQNLLYYTVINYSNAYIERYSVGIYTEENCNNILKSYGYDSLVQIEDLSLKQRIVRNLDELIENKANNYILEIILNTILQDSNSELKRYYLEKKYTINDDFSINIDTSKGLEKSVDLVLREVPAISTSELSVTTDVYHDYDAFVEKDDTWGGIEPGDSDEVKARKKSILKHKLQSLEFDTILTKYITLTRTVDIMESQRELRDMIYLMLSYFDYHDSPEFFKTKILFDTIEVTPAALFGALCWLQQMKFYTNHDDIITDNCVINNSVVFRKMGALAIDLNKLRKVIIVDGKPVESFNITPEISSWKVVDFIKENPDDFKDFMSSIGVDGERIETCRMTDLLDDEGNKLEDGILRLGTVPRDGYKHMTTEEASLDDYLTRFRFFSDGRDLGDFNGSTTFEELLTDYKTQYPNLIERITKKLHDSYDFREYQAWMYMKEQSRTNNSIKFIFKDCTKYTDFLTMMESEALIDYIRSETGYLTWTKDTPNKKKLPAICAVQETINTAFKNWVSNSFSNMIYENSEEDSSTSSYVQDMILLFNEFLSVYSKLYSVNYNYTFGNMEKDGLFLQLFYNPLNIKFKDKYFDYIGLEYTCRSNIKTSYEDMLKLDYKFSTKQYDTFVDNINNKIHFDSETNQYILDDQFKYSFSTKIKDKFFDYVGITYAPSKITVKDKFKDSLHLTGTLKITPFNEETRIYYET